MKNAFARTVGLLALISVLGGFSIVLAASPATKACVGSQNFSSNTGHFTETSYTTDTAGFLHLTYTNISGADILMSGGSRFKYSVSGNLCTSAGAVGIGGPFTVHAGDEVIFNQTSPTHFDLINQLGTSLASISDDGTAGAIDFELYNASVTE